MKLIFIFHVLLVAVIYGCRGKEHDPVLHFIPGTYIRFSQHELGQEYDTLVIELQSSNQYKITRRWKYERTDEAPEYKLQNTSASYNDKHHLLYENETGDVFSFDLKEQILFNGPVKYTKL